MTTAETHFFYKGMLENGLTRYRRPGWHLPKGSRPGKWMPKIAALKPCKSGYHVCTIDQLPEWIAPAIYVVEVRGRHLEDESKSVWEQARLVKRVEGWGMAEMVEWARRCADHVSHLITATYAATAATYAATNATAAIAAIDAATYAAYAIAAIDAATYAAYAATNAPIYAEKRWQVDLLKEMLGLTTNTPPTTKESE